MLWSTNTALVSHKVRLPRMACLIALASLPLLGFAQSARLQVPSNVVVGTSATIKTNQPGDATFYMIAPDHEIKRKVASGEEIRLKPDDLRSAGRYLALLCSDQCESMEFFVSPANVADLGVVVHPSRVPVGQSDAISGAIFLFDKYQNLVLSPTVVKVQLKAGDTELMTRDAPSKFGVSWFLSNSGRSAGPVAVVASANQVEARRVVQQVASDPCNLRLTAQWTAKGIVAETQPVRDCAGNPVPDGTIVTFTETTSAGKSTVDAPVKQGIARAQMGVTGPSVISVASGVVMGNEVKLSERP